MEASLNHKSLVDIHGGHFFDGPFLRCGLPGFAGVAIRCSVGLFGLTKRLVGVVGIGLVEITDDVLDPILDDISQKDVVVPDPTLDDISQKDVVVTDPILDEFSEKYVGVLDPVLDDISQKVVVKLESSSEKCLDDVRLSTDVERESDTGEDSGSIVVELASLSYVYISVSDVV